MNSEWSCSVHVIYSCISKFTICMSQEQVWHDQTSLVSSDECELMKPARIRIPVVFNSSSLRWSQYAFISHLYESTFILYIPVFYFSVNAHLQAQTKITDDTIKVTFSQTHWRSCCHRRHDTTKHNTLWMSNLFLWEHWHLWEQKSQTNYLKNIYIKRHWRLTLYHTLWFDEQSPCFPVLLCSNPRLLVWTIDQIPRLQSNEGLDWDPHRLSALWISSKTLPHIWVKSTLYKTLKFEIFFSILHHVSSLSTPMYILFVLEQPWYLLLTLFEGETIFHL